MVGRIRCGPGARRRYLSHLVAAAGCSWLAATPLAAAAAPAPVAAESDAALEAAIAAATGLPPARTWELTGSARAAFGHKENVLLSAVRSEDSAFARAEAEVFWWRLPTERFEAMAFANTAVTRYFSSADNPREWQAFARAEARWFPARDWQVTTTAEGYHLDQVFDLSTSHAEPWVAQLAVTGAVISTALRWQLRPRTWLELKPAAQRDRYRDGSDDNTQTVGRVTVGQTLRGGRVELAASGQYLRRNYDRRNRYTTGGRALAGTDLDFTQRESEGRVAVTWDEARRWTSTTSLMTGTNRDNGSGYFDYRRRAVRQEVAWQRAPWKVRVSGRLGRFDYDVQTQGIGMNPPARIKEEMLAQARVDRQLNPRTTVYADYTWERSRSNDPLARYRVQTALAGVDWMF